MIVWAVCLLSAIGLSSFLPFWDIPSVSSDLHHLCLEQLNFKTPMADIYKSLVCGKKLPTGGIKKLFIQGGLIHLTVVSGAHLLFLEQFWKKLPLPVLLKTHGLIIMLILYALASHLHPPVLRALFSFFLFRLSHSLKLFWSAHWITLFSGILCLIYQPTWVHSFSLQLSLLASLLQHISTSSIKKCFFIYLFILPVVNRWQALHPLTVLINWTLAPLISSLLFPLSFLSPFFPALYHLTDHLWAIAFHTLKVVTIFPSQSPLMKWHISKEWIWPYIGFVCFFLFAVRLFQRRFWFYPREHKAYR